MKAPIREILALLFLLSCFGIVGRIDYESQLAMAGNHREQMEGRQ